MEGVILLCNIVCHVTPNGQCHDRKISEVRHLRNLSPVKTLSVNSRYACKQYIDSDWRRGHHQKFYTQSS